MAWYMANTDDLSVDHEYGQFENDAEAIAGFREWANGEDFAVLEIYQCSDDECLTPAKLIWH